MAIGKHHSNSEQTGTVVWLTPRDIIEPLGEFDLDPCSPEHRPLGDTARRHYTELEDGLRQPWEGRVWLNPPYGRALVAWMRRMADHDHGTALIFARTETEAFFETGSPRAMGWRRPTAPRRFTELGVASSPFKPRRSPTEGRVSPCWGPPFAFPEHSAMVPGRTTRSRCRTCRTPGHVGCQEKPMSDKAIVTAQQGKVALVGQDDITPAESALQGANHNRAASLDLEHKLNQLRWALMAEPTGKDEDGSDDPLPEITGLMPRILEAQKDTTRNLAGCHMIVDRLLQVMDHAEPR